MKAVLLWLQQNPSAVKAYMVSILALIAKAIMAITGKEADLGVWSGFADQAIDIVVGGLTIYGAVAGTIHVTRGPALTSVDQAAAIVAALAPAPVPEAVAQVKALVTEVVAVKPAVPESHKF